MPRSNTQICAACGGLLDVPVLGGKVKCAYCGTINVVEAQETKKGDGVLCPACGASNPKEAQHCGRCGVKLEFNCPKCNAVNKYGTVYCVKCGVDIQGEIKRERDELERQRAEELQKQEVTRQQTAVEKRKKRTSTCIVSGGLIAILFCIAAAGGGWIYTKNYSPAARSTHTAIAIEKTATTRYSILLQDDFSDPSSGWGEYTSTNGTTGYTSGGYLIQVITKNRLVWDTLPGFSQNDIRIEVDATKTNGQDDSSQFGVACRYQDQDNYYYFAISSNDYAAIFTKVKGKLTVISSADGKWVKVAGINGGSETNHIRADCIGNDLTLYVNGTQLATASSNSFTGGGVALMAGTFGEGGTDILFSNLFVYRP